VIDPLGGSYYMETLTDRMEAEIEAVIERIDAAGGMYKAAESGLVQTMIGESALAFQERVDSGEQKIIGVNCYRNDADAAPQQPTERPDPAGMHAHIARFKAFKAARGQDGVRRALDALARAAGDPADNIFARVVEAAEHGVTHGEIVACLRRELGFGQPLVVA
jgi:methylmalonyl-CoA mutase N-terminal domain/subunit